MTDGEPARHRTTFFILAGLVVVWGAFGVLDIRNQSYSGYLTDGNNTVTRVTPASPAAVAGLRVGDRIVSAGGMSVEDTKAWFQRGRPAIGEVWSYVLQRGGETMTLELRHSALPARQANLAYVAVLLGLCFVGFGLWAYVAAPRAATGLLAAFGLCFGLAFMGSPYFESAGLRNLVNSLTTLVIVLGFAVLVHFLLMFPSRRPVLDRPRGGLLVYGPATVVALFILWFNVVQPAATSGLNVFFRTLIGLFIAGYFIAALALLIRAHARAHPGARAAHGLGLMLIGAVVGLGPLIASAVVGLLSPRTVLPAVDYYFLTLALIPITFAVASVRSARAAPVGP